jgi:predicted SnoaL-like aldol condensation-catalyzing enzyme
MAMICGMMPFTPIRAAAPARCDASPAANKALVLQFYALALGDFKVREAFDRYVDPSFVEHSEDTPGGTVAGTINFLEGLIARFPHRKWEVVRSAADGDLVFLHVRFSPQPDKPATAISEIFRLKNCRLVEHWDVIAGPPDKPINPNPRF